MAGLPTMTADAFVHADIVKYEQHPDGTLTVYGIPSTDALDIDKQRADPDTLHHTPIGVLRSVDRPVYDTQMADQLDTAVEQHGKGDLAALLAGGDTWTVVG